MHLHSFQSMKISFKRTNYINFLFSRENNIDYINKQFIIRLLKSIENK